MASRLLALSAHPRKIKIGRIVEGEVWVMTADRNLAMLIGNGLSIAFSDELLLSKISQEMTERFTSVYTGGTAVATAMQNVAKHVPAGGDPETDFEALIGAFGGQSDILDDLSKFAALTKNSDPEITNAIREVQKFVGEVQRRGIGHTLEIIAERSYSDTERREPLANFFGLLLNEFQDNFTVANLNYDTLVLSVLAESYSHLLSDMADGRFGATLSIGGFVYETRPLRANAAQFLSYERRRLRLLHLHGSLTFWQFGDNTFRKLNVDAVRPPSPIWQILRDEDTFNGRPLVVLANQHDKAQHVTRYPYNLAYDLADEGFKDASHWIIVGYSFRDECVNDMLSRCWDHRTAPTRILVVTNSDRLQADTIEDALGWPSGTAASNGLLIARGGAFGLVGSNAWEDFRAF